MHSHTSKRSSHIGPGATLASALRGFRLVLDGHLGLAQNDPKIRVRMEYPG
jgi:hypothetical protein